MKKLQAGVFSIIRDEEDKSWVGEAFDWVMMFLIILNLVTLVADTFALPAWYNAFTFWVEGITSIAFTLEYALRIWVAPLLYPGLRPLRARIKYILSATAIIDLLSVLPFYLPLLLPVDLRALRIFRLIRLMRLIKLHHYTDSLNTLINVFKKKASQLIISLVVIFLLISVAALLMYDLEHHAQPEIFDNALSGFWWALETVTTVGNGSITPITPVGRLLGAIIGLLGIGVIAVPTGIISAGFINITNENLADSAAPHSPAREIAEYKKLLDAGAINQREYDAKKKSLLSLPHEENT